MTTSNDNLLKQLIEAENSHDVEKVLTFLADEIAYEDVTFGVVMKGKDDFKQIYPTYYHGTPDFKLERKHGSLTISHLLWKLCFQVHRRETFPVCQQQVSASP